VHRSLPDTESTPPVLVDLSGFSDGLVTKNQMLFKMFWVNKMHSSWIVSTGSPSEIVDSWRSLYS